LGHGFPREQEPGFVFSLWQVIHDGSRIGKEAVLPGFFGKRGFVTKHQLAFSAGYSIGVIWW
jgi:hypothetical protein